ncbi:MAG: hypothetical protein ACRD4S_16940 [Candidatus Acidiferrales bacterium]
MNTNYLGLKKPDADTNVVSGNTATGESWDAENLDLLDAAIAADKAVTDHTASGAIAQKQGIVTLTGAAALAMTLANPVAGADDGKILRIISKAAFANTVVVTTGYSGGTNKTATFGAAVGNLLDLVALGGVWYQLPSTGITISA